MTIFRFTTASKSFTEDFADQKKDIELCLETDFLNAKLSDFEQTVCFVRVYVLMKTFICGVINLEYKSTAHNRRWSTPTISKC